MPAATEVKHSGTWRTLKAIEVKHSGSWRTIQEVWAKHSGVWRMVYSGLSALFNTNGDTNTRFSLGIVYAGIQFNSAGTESEYNTAGGLVSIGSWLKAGSASEVWVQLTTHSGSWNSLNAGSGRLQLSTTRSWRLSRSSNGSSSVSCTIKFYDAASGGNELDSVGPITFSAIVEAF
jgi:hypothetical protein